MSSPTPSSRRRLAAAGPGRWRVIATTLAVPAAVAAVLVGGSLVEPSEPGPAAPRQVDVSQTAHACPTAGGWTVAAGQLRAGDSTTVAALGPDGSATTDGDPAAWSVTVPGGESAVLRQKGVGAGGVGFVAATPAAGDGGGYLVGSCPGVTDDAWWVGLGSGGRHQSTLVLTNLSDVPAVADVSLWGTKGPVEGVGNTGILVEPGTTRRIRLEELAAGEAELGVHVQRRRGALAASVIDTSTAVFAGTEMPAAATAARRSQILTGVPTTGSRTLLVANPSEAGALVSVDVRGPAGTFVPEGLADLAVPAGTVVAVPVPDTAGSDAAAWRVRSDQPVVTAVRTAAGAADFAYAVADPVWEDGAVVPVALGAQSARPTVQLTAERAATVTFEAFDAAMTSLGSVPIDVPAEGTSVIDLAPPELYAGDVAYVVARSTAPVRGTATYRLAATTATVSLAEAPVSALSPRVRPDF